MRTRLTDFAQNHAIPYETDRTVKHPTQNKYKAIKMQGYSFKKKRQVKNFKKRFEIVKYTV